MSPATEDYSSLNHVKCGSSVQFYFGECFQGAAEKKGPRRRGAAWVLGEISTTTQWIVENWNKHFRRDFSLHTLYLFNLMSRKRGTDSRHVLGHHTITQCCFQPKIWHIDSNIYICGPLHQASC